MLKKQEFWALNWLRFFLSVYLVLFHTLNEPYSLDETYPVISALLDLGNFATSIFFVLSGFLLTYVYVALRDGKKIDAASFLVSRLSALYPIHLFTICLALPLFIALSYYHGGVEVPVDVFWKETRILGLGETVLAVLMNLTLTHAWNPLYMILNPPSWSLSALLFFYILFPSIAPRLHKSRSPGILLFLLGLLFFIPGAVAQLAGWSDLVTDGVLHRNPVVRLPLFLGGILLCVIYARRSLAGSAKPGVIANAAMFGLIVLTIVIATYWQMKNPEQRLYMIRNGLYYAASLAAVWAFANAAPTASKWNQQWSARLGKASLSIFALHFPLFDIFRRTEKFVRTYILANDSILPAGSSSPLAQPFEPIIGLYPIYFILVILASVALQESIVNPLQALIKRRYVAWKSQGEMTVTS